MSSSLIILSVSSGILFLATLKILHLWYLARASVHWPSVEGVISESTLQERGRGRDPSPAYAKIRFTYTVNGSDFCSRWKSFTLYAGDDAAFVLDHPRGKNVQVFYNPHNPKEAVLQTGEAYTNWLAALCLFASTLLCIVFLIRELH